MFATRDISTHEYILAERPLVCVPMDFSWTLDFVSMDESFRDDFPQVSPQENKLLVAPFFESEVKEAIFQMKK